MKALYRRNGSLLEDLRQKIVAIVRRGMPKMEAIRLLDVLDVSLSSVERCARIAGAGSSLAPKKRSGQPRR